MQKYKLVASKSQKKYTIIISAKNEQEAKSRLHKEGYSILGISKFSDIKIEGQKFLFQVEYKGQIQNGVIIGKDIFKVYIKLRDELDYSVVFLYPEGDSAENNAEKKQKIIQQLERGYELQRDKVVQQKEKSEESFFIQKKLQETYILIEKVLLKLENIISQSSSEILSPEVIGKLQKIYENLIRIKTSTNISKLREIGELALMKIAEIELKQLEKSKDSSTRDLLSDTNTLLKKFGSSKQFIEADKDIKKIISDFFIQFKNAFTPQAGNNKASKNTGVLLDKNSYNFLKTVLLLEKYKEKLQKNTKEIYSHLQYFINPFSKSPEKERILLKRKVIKQNISILKAKKNGTMSSYTGIKKGYHKFIEEIISYFQYLGNILFILICVYIFIFSFSISTLSYSFQLSVGSIGTFLLFFLLYFVFSTSKNLSVFILNIVFFSFIYIFSRVNF